MNNAEIEALVNQIKTLSLEEQAVAVMCIDDSILINELNERVNFLRGKESRILNAVSEEREWTH